MFCRAASLTFHEKPERLVGHHETQHLEARELCLRAEEHAPVGCHPQSLCRASLLPKTNKDSAARATVVSAAHGGHVRGSETATVYVTVKKSGLRVEDTWVCTRYSRGKSGQNGVIYPLVGRNLTRIG